jgi:hypothetical protein
MLARYSENLAGKFLALWGLGVKPPTDLKDAHIVAGRNLYDPALLRSLGLTHESIGCTGVAN